MIRDADRHEDVTLMIHTRATATMISSPGISWALGSSHEGLAGLRLGVYHGGLGMAAGGGEGEIGLFFLKYL